MRFRRYASLACLHLLAAVAAAQAPVRREPLKQGTPPAAPRALCPPALPPAAPSDADREKARDLAQRALQAALLGDSTAARDELREAATLDPTNADLAYRLGRAHEAVRASTDAAAAYCRFLTLAANAPEAAEVRARVTALTASLPPDPRTTPTLASFQAGISAYESGRIAEAEAAFTTTIGGAPQWPEPYYNRAMALLARGQNEAAVRDLEQFLRLKPETSDRVAIVTRIASLRRATFAPSPTTALAAGLALPGAGQYYTRRPMRGAITTAAAGVAFVVALMQRTSTSTVERTGTDPFGNPYTYTTTLRTKERPYAVPGVALGLGIAAASAYDAFKYARQLAR